MNLTQVCKQISSGLVWGENPSRKSREGFLACRLLHRLQVVGITAYGRVWGVKVATRNGPHRP